MYKIIEIKDKKGNLINAVIKTLSNKYIESIMNLQDEIINSLDDKSFFARTEKHEFEDIINTNGEILGVFTEEDKLIAFGAMVKPHLLEFNLGYDLNFDKSKLMKVAHMESTVVHPSYRGNRLQRLLVQYLEEIAIKKGCNIFCATVAPNNKFSLNTLLQLEYKIALEKEKYGGLKRYIVIKEKSI